MKTALQAKHFLNARSGFLDGSSSPRAFLEGCLARIEETEPVVKAFKHLDTEGARSAADAASERYKAGRPLSVLDGCPVGVKDIIETRDMPTGFGSPAFEGNETHRDAACVQALRQGGAVIVGKTVTTEFAIGFSGETTNPHNGEHTPGGSSSGSAAAVGGGMLPLALGTQTNGSVLRPASFNGIFGYKGTFGSLPMGGVHPVSLSHDHLGVFANDLDDLWAAASLISRGLGSPGNAPLQGAADAAPEPLKPRRLVRLHLEAWEELEAPHKAIIDAEVQRIAAAGVEIVDRQSDPRVAVLEEMLDRDSPGSADMIAYDMRWPFTGYVERFGDQIGDRIRGIIERTGSISPADYEALLMRREAARHATTHALTAIGADAFLMPASSSPAPQGLAYTGSRAYLVYWSWLGFPAFSLPVMEADRLPWGLQVMHTAGHDSDLCRVARWIAGEAAS